MKVLHIGPPHYLCSLGANMLGPGVPYTVPAAHGPYPSDWQGGVAHALRLAASCGGGGLSWREAKSGKFQIRGPTAQGPCETAALWHRGRLTTT